MTIKFKAPDPKGRAEPRKMISVTPLTHNAVKLLAAKHELSMTRMLDAIVQYHNKYNET